VDQKPTLVLPKRVLLQGSEADRLISAYRRARNAAAPKIGRPRKAIVPNRYLAFVGDSLEDIDRQMRRFGDLLGPRGKGNKRWGRIHLFYDLYNHFVELERLGVTLPRGNELSANACRHGLVEILHAYKLTPFSSKELLASSLKRRVVATKMKRIFQRVSAFVQKKTRA
jgi:hypothetical protein